MGGPANYVGPEDVLAYLPNADLGQEQASWDLFAGVASRALDDWCDRPGFFPDPITGVKYFDIDGDLSSDTQIWRRQLESHDFYGATIIKIATRENADPAVAGDWITLAGDGILPPSDYFLEPANQTYVGKSGDVNLKPFYRIELPETPPINSSTFQSSFKVGKRTLSINPAGWGWPTTPDDIRHIAAKLVVRMWKSKESGWTGAVGSPELGTQIVLKYLDASDFSMLDKYKKYSAG